VVIMENWIDCSKARTLSALAGATVLYTGMDRAFPAPPWVHYALGGVAVDFWCRGMDMNNLDSEMAIRAACGYGGAYAAIMFLAR
jgi:hypothetical protein